jgi:CubicO group peptidase (beta-lactamase class C family)
MKKIITLLSCMIIAQSFYAQSEKTLQERLDKFDKALNQKISGDGAGLSIIITHKNNVVFEKYMGYADFETMEKLNADHVLGIASMSKQFLGMATLMLVEEGKIDLDKNIKEYLPELSIGDRNINVIHLLTHTSGLPELTQNEKFMNNISIPHTVNQIIDMGLKGEYRSEPGEKFIYCNTGYTIMTALIEQQSGMDFSTFLEERIFKPLKMDNTYSCDYKQDAINAVQRYARDSAGYHDATIMHFSNLIGGGAVISNARDMAKWCMALISGQNLPDNYTDLWKPVLLNSGESTGYGLGMGVNNHDGRTYYYHPGMGDGMNSVDLIFLEEEMSITVIRNVHPPIVNSNEIALMAADYLFED